MVLRFKSNMYTCKCVHVVVHYPRREELRTTDDENRRQLTTKMVTRDDTEKRSEEIDTGQLKSNGHKNRLFENKRYLAYHLNE